MSTEPCLFVPMRIHRQMQRKLRELGAKELGLCRTEYMFFEGDRIEAFREMICSRSVAREKKLWRSSFHYSRVTSSSYTRLWKNPVTIRFLDPPLHEFVPTAEG
ncbi:MAG: putative PEP-binding protein [Lachnospiraceae bacterium]